MHPLCHQEARGIRWKDIHSGEDLSYQAWLCRSLCPLEVTPLMQSCPVAWKGGMGPSRVFARLNGMINLTVVAHRELRKPEWRRMIVPWCTISLISKEEDWGPCVPNPWPLCSAFFPGYCLCSVHVSRFNKWLALLWTFWSLWESETLKETSLLWERVDRKGVKVGKGHWFIWN